MSVASSDSRDARTRDGGSEVASVISVCSAKDVETWSHASRHIPRFISARRYAVYVPDAEVGLFRTLSDPSFEVIPETDLCGGLAARIKARMPAGAPTSMGWYLQQFIKMQAIAQSGDDDLALVWDADTVPLRPLRFQDEAGRIVYYQGREFHRPYFDFIERFLRRPCAVPPFSFIAQCFPMRGRWMRAFREQAERAWGMPWDEAILKNIDFAQTCAFSEYETLGTYVATTWPDEMVVSSRPWARLGNSLIGGPAQLSEPTIARLSATYDFISFERWDDRSLAQRVRARVPAPLQGLRSRLFR